MCLERGESAAGGPFPPACVLAGSCVGGFVRVQFVCLYKPTNLLSASPDSLTSESALHLVRSIHPRSTLERPSATLPRLQHPPPQIIHSPHLSSPVSLRESSISDIPVCRISLLAAPSQLISSLALTHLRIPLSGVQRARHRAPPRARSAAQLRYARRGRRLAMKGQQAQPPARRGPRARNGRTRRRLLHLLLARLLRLLGQHLPPRDLVTQQDDERRLHTKARARSSLGQQACRLRSDGYTTALRKCKK